MTEGFTENEIADYADALYRRGLGSPVRPELPWATMSGFTDKTTFYSALARSWPMFPATGDNLSLFKILHWPRPVIMIDRITRAIPVDEISL